MSKREVTMAEAVKELQAGSKQTRYVTKAALAELAKMRSLEDLRRSKNSHKPGKW